MSLELSGAAGEIQALNEDIYKTSKNGNAFCILAYNPNLLGSIK